MEQKHIFEGAKFGDRFITRDGHIGIYHYKKLQKDPNNGEVWHYLMFEPIEVDGMFDFTFTYVPYEPYVEVNGKGYPENLKAYNLEKADSPNYGVVIQSKYVESIDEEKLDQLAKTAMHEVDAKGLVSGFNEDEYKLQGIYQGFKIGYRKAKEE